MDDLDGLLHTDAEVSLLTDDELTAYLSILGELRVDAKEWVLQPRQQTAERSTDDQCLTCFMTHRKYSLRILIIIIAKHNQAEEAMKRAMLLMGVFVAASANAQPTSTGSKCWTSPGRT